MKLKQTGIRFALILAISAGAFVPALAQAETPTSTPPTFIGIIEDGDASAFLAALHDQLVDMGIDVSRPLQGQLGDCGFVWQLPENIDVSVITAFIEKLQGVIDVEIFDPQSIKDIIVNIDPELREAAVAALEELGFTFLCTDPKTGNETWSYYTAEYWPKSAPTTQNTVYAADVVSGIDGITLPEINPPCPPWDTNCDCIASIIDLIRIRSHLGADPTSDTDAARCDVNGDGKINIIDMITVRNHLGERCEVIPQQ